MSTLTPEGTRIGEPRTGWDDLLAGVAFVPERARGSEARALLERDSAVILPGLPVNPDSLMHPAGALRWGVRGRRRLPAR